MSLSKEIRTVAFVLWMTLVILCSLIIRNTTAVYDGNKLGERQEYQRVLFGCSSDASINSTDPLVRELCDETLVRIAERQER